MARSSYIWVVTAETDDFLHVMATFTVKHELITWCKRRTDTYPHELDTLDVTKHHDNPRTTEMLEDVREFGTVREFLEREDV